MEAVEPPREKSLLERIRNMWEFSNLAQWIFFFGSAVKIDENLDIEVSSCSWAQDTSTLDMTPSTNAVLQDLEMECLKTHSTVLAEIGLALLKFVSSHRGLTSVLLLNCPLIY